MQQAAAVCTFCDKTFKNSKYLSEHRIKIHGVTVRKKENFKCLEKDCCFITGCRQGLIQHLSVDHQFHFEEKVQTFITMKDFIIWKEEKENSDSSHYIHASGTNKIGNSKVFYYSCNRSGNYVANCDPDSRKRALKTQGSVKIDAKCTAYMKVSEDCDSKQVTVTYCPDHYGHKITVAHIPMSNNTRLAVAGKLKCGITPGRILQDCHSANIGSGNDSICERERLICRKDLNNIRKQFNIAGVCRHKDDHISVGMWVNELCISGNSDIILYKPVGEICEQFPNLAKEDFLLIIQTKFQLQQYVAFAKDAVCIDSTHNTTHYDLKLTTVLCIDEWGEGVPVLWAISSREDTPMVNTIFCMLNERAPGIIPEYLMSDDAPVYFTAFKQVFSEASTKKLLCSWHFERAWQRAIVEKIKNKDLQDEIYQELRVIAHTQNPQEFNELFKIFMNKLRNNTASKDFEQYFASVYGNRIHEWAAWERKNSLVNTNMYVEAFHKVLKHGDNLQGKQNKRLDSLIDVLFKLETYYVDERVRKMEKGKVTKRIENINARHRSSLNMTDAEYIVEKGIGNIWKFQNKNYSVIKKSCTRSVCKLECTMCQICIHAYSCSCPDMLYVKTICKHIHYVHRLIVKNQNASNCTELDSSKGSKCMQQEHDYANLNVECSNITEATVKIRREELRETLISRKPQKNLDKLKDELRQLMFKLSGLCDSCDDLQTVQEIKSRLQSQILPVFSMDREAKTQEKDVQNTPMPQKYSSNKNFDLQPRLKRNKKRKRSANFRHSSESTLTARSRLRALQRVCSTCNLDEDNNQENVITWIACSVCGAWHHEACVYSSTEDSFLCLLCK